MSVPVRTTVFVGALLTLFAAGCRSPYYADRGAAAGGLTGAALGAVIGEHNDNPLAGAIIGGAVGTLTGAAVGDAIDSDIARNDAIIQQQLGRRLAGAVTSSDVIQMTHAGLGEDVIVTHIRANGVAQRPSVQEMIALKNQGVSDAVINALQSQPPIQSTGAPPTGQPVVIQEHHYVAPPYWGPRHCYHHHPHYRRSGVSWGVSFGH
ncbi:MAG: glycine zipper domain-containing protein [Pirellulaceae bacterium]